MPARAVVGERLPPLVVRQRRRSFAPSRSTASTLVRGAELRHHDRARNAQGARAPRDALRHVAGARRVHAVGQRLARQRPNRVRRAAQLERADRLQRLELEIDLRRRVDVRGGRAASEWRSPAMRSRAARMSSIVGGSMRRNTRSAELDANAGARRDRLGVDVRRGREIFDRQTERLEQRDLAWRRAVRRRGRSAPRRSRRRCGRARSRPPAAARECRPAP